jgi:hypothetical protein
MFLRNLSPPFSKSKSSSSNLPEKAEGKHSAETLLRSTRHYKPEVRTVVPENGAKQTINLKVKLSLCLTEVYVGVEV